MGIPGKIRRIDQNGRKYDRRQIDIQTRLISVRKNLINIRSVAPNLVDNFLKKYTTENINHLIPAQRRELSQRLAEIATVARRAVKSKNPSIVKEARNLARNLKSLRGEAKLGNLTPKAHGHSRLRLIPNTTNDGIARDQALRGQVAEVKAPVIEVKSTATLEVINKAVEREVAREAARHEGRTREDRSPERVESQRRGLIERITRSILDRFVKIESFSKMARAIVGMIISQAVEKSVSKEAVGTKAKVEKESQKAPLIREGKYTETELIEVANRSYQNKARFTARIVREAVSLVAEARPNEVAGILRTVAAAVSKALKTGEAPPMLNSINFAPKPAEIVIGAALRSIFASEAVPAEAQQIIQTLAKEHPASTLPALLSEHSAPGNEAAKTAVAEYAAQVATAESGQKQVVSAFAQGEQNPLYTQLTSSSTGREIIIKAAESIALKGTGTAAAIVKANPERYVAAGLSLEVATEFIEAVAGVRTPQAAEPIRRQDVNIAELKAKTPNEFTPDRLSIPANGELSGKGALGNEAEYDLLAPLLAEESASAKAAAKSPQAGIAGLTPPMMPEFIQTAITQPVQQFQPRFQTLIERLEMILEGMQKSAKAQNVKGAEAQAVNKNSSLSKHQAAIFSQADELYKKIKKIYDAYYSKQLGPEMGLAIDALSEEVNGVFTEIKDVIKELENKGENADPFYQIIATLTIHNHSLRSFAEIFKPREVETMGLSENDLIFDPMEEPQQVAM